MLEITEGVGELSKKGTNTKLQDGEVSSKLEGSGHDVKENPDPTTCSQAGSLTKEQQDDIRMLIKLQVTWGFSLVRSTGAHSIAWTFLKVESHSEALDSSKLVPAGEQ